MNICILNSFEDLLLRDTGYSIRIYNLAKNLAKLGNKVFVIIPGFNSSVKKVNGLTIYTINGFLPKWALTLLGKFLGASKISAMYFYDPIFIGKANKIIQRCDIIQIEQQSTGFLLAIIAKRIWKKIVSVDCHDVFQSLRLGHTSKVRRVLETFFEILAYRYTSLILTVSEKEKEILTSLGIPGEKIKVTPNGVDIERFDNQSIDLVKIKRRYGLENHRVVVFVGNMEYLPNKEAVKLIATKIAPLVCKKVNNAKFLIVGRFVERINSPHLIFTGTVRDVVEPLAISDVAIAPLFRGSGTRLKVLEYLACGLPVVSTTKGVEGLNLENGSLIIEDDVYEFAKSIIKLLKNPDLAEKLRRNARKSIMAYDWKKISAQLHEIYEEFLRTEPCCY